MMRTSRIPVSSRWLVLLALLFIKLDAVVLAEQHPTIPRSNNRYTHYQSSSATVDGEISPSSSSPELMLNVQSTTFYPPWNPSSKIDSDGFLCDVYTRCPGEWELHANIGGMHGGGPGGSFGLIRGSGFLKQFQRDKLLTIPVIVRQVPGDGNCLFHSIAACLYRAVNGTHLPMNSHDRVGRLRYTSLQMRNAAVDVLQGKQNIGFGGIRGRRLFLQGDEYLEASELLSAAAAQFDLTGEEYCDLMRQESYWGVQPGGGPEIVALCNYLQRPIHIYELIPSDESTSHQLINDQSTNINMMLFKNNTAIKINKQFALRRMACFGSPKFDRRDPLHILSADSRFPDVDAHRIRRVGNHFLALFPVDTCNNAVVDGTSAAATLGFMRHAPIGGRGLHKSK